MNTQLKNVSAYIILGVLFTALALTGWVMCRKAS